MTTRAAALESIEGELRSMVRRIKRLLAERAAQTHPELQPLAWVVLGWVADHGPARSSSLALDLEIDKGAISRQVQHLVELGLVERTADPEDGRATLLSLSGTGADLVERGRVEQRRLWEKRLSGWTVAEMRAFAAQLHRLNSDLETGSGEH